MGEQLATTTRSSTAPEVFSSLPFELSEQVRQRLGVSAEQMAAYIGVTYRTYQRRSQAGSLADAESAKVEMLDSLLNLGERVFGDVEQARVWLTSPVLSLQGELPIELLDTVRGYERVKNKLLQIEYGNY